MSINSYIGIEGISINLETREDLVEAIDILHTQTIDAFGEESIECSLMTEFYEKVLEKLKD